jgi:hypothetical protein
MGLDLSLTVDKSFSEQGRCREQLGEVGGKIYVVGGFGGERELEIAVAFQEARSECTKKFMDGPVGVGKKSNSSDPRNQLNRQLKLPPRQTLDALSSRFGL